MEPDAPFSYADGDSLGLSLAGLEPKGPLISKL